MKFTKRIFTSVLLTICLLFNCVAFAGNAVVMTEEERAKLFDDLICQRDLAVIQGDTEKVEELNRQLFALGMEELTTAEILQKEGTSEIRPFFVTPNTSNIAWSSQRYVLKDEPSGKKYEVQVIYASPVDKAERNLREQTSVLAAPNTSYNSLALTLELLYVGAGTAASQVPGGDIVMTALDLLIAVAGGGEPDTVVLEGATTAFVLYNYTTVRLAYVKEYGYPDDTQVLSFISTQCKSKVDIFYSMELEDPSEWPVTQAGTYSAYYSTKATSYDASLATIVANYLYNSILRSYVSSIPFYHRINNVQRTIYTFSPIAPQNIAHILV